MLLDCVLDTFRWARTSSIYAHVPEISPLPLTNLVAKRENLSLPDASNASKVGVQFTSKPTL